MMIYRIFNPEIGNQIIDLCEHLNIDYDIYNAEDLFNPESRIEIGINQNDWCKIEDKL